MQVIHVDDYKEKFSNIRSGIFQVKVVMGKNVNIIGQIPVNIKYQCKEYVLPLIAVDNSVSLHRLLGRN